MVLRRVVCFTNGAQVTQRIKRSNIYVCKTGTHNQQPWPIPSNKAHHVAHGSHWHYNVHRPRPATGTAAARAWDSFYDCDATVLRVKSSCRPTRALHRQRCCECLLLLLISTAVGDAWFLKHAAYERKHRITSYRASLCVSAADIGCHGDAVLMHRTTCSNRKRSS